jgi:hypothetical protein
MRLLLPVLVAIVLSFPSPGGAGTLTFEIGGDLAVDFGKVPVEISSDADGDVGYGSFEFVSGPYLGGQYFYGVGTLTMELTVFNPDGDDFEGTFHCTGPALLDRRDRASRMR